jgi:chromosome segregation ATPase
VSALTSKQLSELKRAHEERLARAAAAHDDAAEALRDEFLLAKAELLKDVEAWRTRAAEAAAALAAAERSADEAKRREALANAQEVELRERLATLEAKVAALEIERARFASDLQAASSERDAAVEAKRRADADAAGAREDAAKGATDGGRLAERVGELESREGVGRGACQGSNFGRSCLKRSLRFEGSLRSRSCGCWRREGRRRGAPSRLRDLNLKNGCWR